MGYMRHHAIVVSGWDKYDDKDEQYIDRAHREVIALQESFPSLCWVSPVSPKNLAINGYRSFFIAPDGSKEGWTESNNGEAFRTAVMNKLDEMTGNGCWVQYAEVQFADDEGVSVVTRAS